MATASPKGIDCQVHVQKELLPKRPWSIGSIGSIGAWSGGVIELPVHVPIDVIRCPVNAVGVPFVILCKVVIGALSLSHLIETTHMNCSRHLAGNAARDFHDVNLSGLWPGATFGGKHENRWPKASAFGHSRSDLQSVTRTPVKAILSGQLGRSVLAHLRLLTACHNLQHTILHKRIGPVISVVQLPIFHFLHARHLNPIREIHFVPLELVGPKQRTGDSLSRASAGFVVGLRLHVMTLPALWRAPVMASQTASWQKKGGWIRNSFLYTTFELRLQLHQEHVSLASLRTGA
mmetsp:Transcript_14147/g.31337  ORF Transcript_14147/g.31337 Transcript_14147/m.31337 type:complete len:291 (+) Transcript_14147:137-1009(+)